VEGEGPFEQLGNFEVNKNHHFKEPYKNPSPPSYENTKKTSDCDTPFQGFKTGVNLTPHDIPRICLGT